MPEVTNLQTLELELRMYSRLLVLIHRPAGLFNWALVAGPPLPELPEEPLIPAKVLMIPVEDTALTLWLPESET